MNLIKKTYSQLCVNIKKINIKSVWLCGRLCVWALQKIVFKLGDKNFIPASDERISFLKNYKYELGASILSSVVKEMKFPKILTIEETINLVIKEHKSVCRFGDGEFKYLLGLGDSKLYFGQKPAEKLKHRLSEVLHSSHSDILICIYDFFASLDKYNYQHQKIARHHMCEFREKIYPFLDFERLYGNAFISRPYLSLADKSKTGVFFNEITQLWDKQDIIIIEGAFSKLGIGNDLFDNARSVKRVLCPPCSAFDKYEEILAFAKTLPKNKLILIALGMTATVLAYDLAGLGYWAVDIGHIDLEYEWYQKKAKKPIKIMGKYVNDVSSDISDLLVSNKQPIQKDQILKIME